MHCTRTSTDDMVAGAQAGGTSLALSHGRLVCSPARSAAQRTLLMLAVATLGCLLASTGYRVDYLVWALRWSCCGIRGRDWTPGFWLSFGQCRLLLYATSHGYANAGNNAMGYAQCTGLHVGRARQMSGQPWSGAMTRRSQQFR